MSWPPISPRCQSNSVDLRPTLYWVLGTEYFDWSWPEGLGLSKYQVLSTKYAENRHHL